MNYTNTKYNPPTSPDKSAIENLASIDKAAAVKLSSGPKTPDPLEAPGLGAWPLSASPPPLRLCVAVGRGDVDFVEVELPPPDPVELFPEPEAFEFVVSADITLRSEGLAIWEHGVVRGIEDPTEMDWPHRVQQDL